MRFAWRTRLVSLTRFCRWFGWAPHTPVSFAGPFRVSMADCDDMPLTDLEWRTYCIWCGRKLEWNGQPSSTPAA